MERAALKFRRETLGRRRLSPRGLLLNFLPNRPYDRAFPRLRETRLAVGSFG